MLFIKWQNLVVEQIRGRYRCFGGIQFGKTYLGIGINKGLLVNTSDTFDIANIIGVLTTQISRRAIA